jgi:uncharacterized phage protein (TIGR01671 family)
MREIKHRGKRLDNKEWIYGSLRIENDHAFILEDTYSIKIPTPEYHGEAMGCGIEDADITNRYEACAYGWSAAIERFKEQFPKWVEVDPETVGQFTGLPDKNGTEMYEGDIVRHFNRIEVGEPDAYYDGYVRWNDSRLRFEHQSPGEAFTIGTGTTYEVIGNVHDNPELLNSEASV